MTLALVFSGGDALGAYHGGAYAGLHAQGFRPDWVVGGSIGAVTAAIIAGHPPDLRVEKLRAFWSSAASSADLGLAPTGGSVRHRMNVWSGLQSLLFGRPGLFRHRFPGVLSAFPGMPTDVSLFDLDTLRRSLTRFVDFDRLNGADVRLSFVATDIETGERVTFDNREGPISPDHLLASCAFPGKFPPVRVENRLLADAALSTNLPVDLVFQDMSQDLLCIAIDLFSPRGTAPDSIDAAIKRLQDIVFGNQSEAVLRLLEQGAASARPDGEGRSAARLLHLSYSGFDHESGLKMLDFSQSSIKDRWAAGERESAAALDRLGALGPIRPGLEVLRVR